MAALDFSDFGKPVEDETPSLPDFSARATPIDEPTPARVERDDATLGTAMQRGMGQLAQGAHATVAAAEARTLQTMDRIDRGERVADADDPVGYQYLDAAQRKLARTEAEKALSARLSDVARHSKTVEGIPEAPAVKRLKEA